MQPAAAAAELNPDSAKPGFKPFGLNLDLAPFPGQFWGFLKLIMSKWSKRAAAAAAAVASPPMAAESYFLHLASHHDRSLRLAPAKLPYGSRNFGLRRTQGPEYAASPKMSSRLRSPSVDALPQRRPQLRPSMHVNSRPWRRWPGLGGGLLHLRRFSRATLWVISYSSRGA